MIGLERDAAELRNPSVLPALRDRQLRSQLPFDILKSLGTDDDIDFEKEETGQRQLQRSVRV